MKTIIAGSRTITNINVLQTALEHYRNPITEIVSGGAKGADYIGETFARDFGIPLKKFPANWNKFGRSAGHIRNKEMAQYAEACIVLWDGASKGSASMIKLAKEHGLSLLVYNLATKEIDKWPMSIKDNL